MLEVCGECGPGRPWVVAVAPDAEEMATLEREHGVPAVLIEHSLDARERPRVDHEGEATLIVVRVPHRTRPGADLPWTTVPVGIVSTPSAVVTISIEATEIPQRVLSSRSELGATHFLLLAHLRAVADAFIDSVASLEGDIDLEEARLERSHGNQEVLALVRLMKSLVHFTAALRGAEHVVERLMRTGSSVVPEAEHGALEDTLIEIRQAIETVNLERETLAGTMDAFASIISNNLNVVMKLLAGITLVLTPPIALAGFWGMNVPVPGTAEPTAFVALLGVAALTSGLTALELRRRRWL